MKRSVNKILDKVGLSLPRVNSTGTNANDIVPGTAAFHFPSANSSVFIEYYEALLWMNGNMRQLEGLVDWLI